MASVGEKLRHERERRDTTIEELARATHIDLRYLHALEQNEVEALPGRAFGKLYIRAYAEVLGFDPQPLIDDYDREQRGPPPEPHDEPARPPRPVEAAIARWREAKLAERRPAVQPAESTEAEPEVPAAEPDLEPQVESLDRPAETPAISRPRRPSRRRLAIALGSLVLVAVAIWLALASRNWNGTAVPEIPRQDWRPVAPLPSAVPAVDPAPDAEPVLEPAPSSPHLTIAEFVVGRRIVGRRLEGRGDRFAPGEVAWFQTHVLGGAAGESIRHVWLHEDRVVHSIELELGGPRWRTHSRATLGHAGRWAVEARDAQGRVLARAELDCE